MISLEAIIQDGASEVLQYNESGSGEMDEIEADMLESEMIAASIQTISNSASHKQRTPTYMRIRNTIGGF